MYRDSAPPTVPLSLSVICSKYLQIVPRECNDSMSYETYSIPNFTAWPIFRLLTLVFMSESIIPYNVEYCDKTAQSKLKLTKCVITD